MHFENKEFVRATTKGFLHIPINMGRVFNRVQTHIDEADADDNIIVLSRDLPSTRAELLFSVTKSVPDEDRITLTGDFITMVFEGPYRNVRLWQMDMQKWFIENGGTLGEVYFFYTNRPECANDYKLNYIVDVARTSAC